MIPCVECFNRGVIETFIATREGARLEVAPCRQCYVPGAYARRLTEILSSTELARPDDPNRPKNVLPFGK